jgi:hypothetical protein
LLDPDPGVQNQQKKIENIFKNSGFQVLDVIF